MKLLKQNYVKYGLIMCGVIIACLVFMELTGQNNSFEKAPIQGIVMMFAPAVIWFLGIRAKKKEQKGKLTFKEGVKEGFKISLVYALVSPFIFLVYYLLINPQILNYAAEVYGLKASPPEVVIVLDMTVQFVAALVFGTLYAAIISFFLKTKK